MHPYGYSFSCLFDFLDLIFFNKGCTTSLYYFYFSLTYSALTCFALNNDVIVAWMLRLV